MATLGVEVGGCLRGGGAAHVAYLRCPVVTRWSSTCIRFAKNTEMTSAFFSAFGNPDVSFWTVSMFPCQGQAALLTLLQMAAVKFVTWAEKATKSYSVTNKSSQSSQNWSHTFHEVEHVPWDILHDVAADLWKGKNVFTYPKDVLARMRL